jgi:germination protein M
MHLKKKNLHLTIALGILAIAIFVVAFSFVDRDQGVVEPSVKTVRLYFLNPSSKAIEHEERSMPIEDEAAMTRNVLRMFLDGPKNQLLQKPLPEGVEISGETKLVTDPATTEVTFEIEFSEAYNSMSPIEEAFFRSAFVWTMTELGFIDNVTIFAGGKKLVTSRGEPMEFLSREDVIIDPVLSSIINKSVKLYFSNEAGDALVAENRVIEVSPDLHMEPFIVEQIIKGPQNPGCYPTISSDVKVRAVNTDEGVCYINLSSDFLTKTPNSQANENVMIYSLVNSLLELSNVKKVKFLVESAFVTEPFRNAIDLNTELERNVSLIQEDDME